MVAKCKVISFVAIQVLYALSEDPTRSLGETKCLFALRCRLSSPRSCGLRPRLRRPSLSARSSLPFPLPAIASVATTISRPPKVRTSPSAHRGAPASWPTPPAIPTGRPASAARPSITHPPRRPLRTSAPRATCPSSTSSTNLPVTTPLSSLTCLSTTLTTARSRSGRRFLHRLPPGRAARTGHARLLQRQSRRRSDQPAPASALRSLYC